jgi:hypothetical protein
MLGEEVEHPFEMVAVEDQQPVETLRSDGADEALGDRIPLRRSHRRADDLDPFSSEDDVEVTRELAVAVPDQKAHRRRTLRQSPRELTGLLGDPGAARVRRAAGEMHPAATELDEEENVQPPQGDGLAGRPQTHLPEELAYGRGRDCQAEPAQLADDPLVASTRVLAGESQHQLSDLAADRWPADSTRIRPAPWD